RLVCLAQQLVEFRIRYALELERVAQISPHFRERLGRRAVAIGAFGDPIHDAIHEHPVTLGEGEGQAPAGGAVGAGGSGHGGGAHGLGWDSEGGGASAGAAFGSGAPTPGEAPAPGDGAGAGGAGGSLPRGTPGSSGTASRSFRPCSWSRM